MSRRDRERRRAERLLVGIAVGVLVAAAGLIAWLAPRESEKPLVTVYMRADCESCRRWMNYLAQRGFRTQLGNESDWAAVRARFKLSPRFRGLHTAVVEGLYLEGHVPASDIHFVLKQRDHDHVKGLVVPGLPQGAPGLESAFPQPFVVYAFRGFGIMEPYVTHEHYVSL